MADNQQSPGPGWTQNSGGDWEPPSDNQFPYAVGAMGKPSFPTPGAGPTGHKSAVDPLTVQRQASAAWQAAQAAAQAKSDAQRRADVAAVTRAAAKFTPKGK